MATLSGSSTGRIATRALTRDADGGLAWLPGGLARVRASLSEELDGPQAGAAVDDLLRLMVVLRKKRGAPEAADALADALRSVPGAVDVVRRRHVSVGGIDARRMFMRREGREADMTAPDHAAEAPQGTLPLKAMFEPLDRDRAKQIARRRKEIQDGRG